MIREALKVLQPAQGSLLFIENVGNLVCPAMFDLGENARVIVMSVTEGDDKPLKYPTMFETSQLCLINKTDLLPYVDFDVQKAMENALKVNPRLNFIEVSARTGKGMEQWFGWLSDLKVNR
jgi:hydrogenase nickel incorporation protein HypB